MPIGKTLAELNVHNLERAKIDRHLAFTTYPELLYPILLRPCTVNILMVTDAGGSFGNGDFGLDELLEVLSISPGPYVRFAVTKAHRNSFAAGADLVNFKFDGIDLNTYDQIWMIGVSRSGAKPLTESELRAVSQFMDGGGGVFATGDHEDLGVDMCGRVPRVRSMRKWHWPNPGPLGEPVAPGGSDTTRLDTNQAGHNATLTFDDQSDDVPQQTMPVMHYAPTPYFFRRIVYPHPILCGPNGVIRFLPDHAHEGECYVPSDLTKTFTFDGYTTTEYPILTGTTRLEPELVSRSNSGTGIVDQSKQLGAHRVFGANAAYDGHLVNVGRVVVESTWHHLFNINLKGVPGNSDPIKQVGFKGSTDPVRKAQYEEIKAYFRNIAVWLARPSKHQCMRWKLLWALRWDSRLFMDLHPTNNIAKIELPELLRIGLVARDVLGRYATQCQSYQWILELITISKVRFAFEPTYPWPRFPKPSPNPDPITHYYSEASFHAVLGALVYGIAAKFPEPTDDARKAAESDVLDTLIQEAAKVSEAKVREAARGSFQSVGQMIK